MSGRCEDVYKEEIDKQIKTLKRFREAWLKSSFHSNMDLFQYGDDDFYFYRFSVSRAEASTEQLLDNIMYRVLEEYKIDFLVPDDIKNAPFNFIINGTNARTGISFKDFYEDEDINGILNENDLSCAYIVRTTKDSESVHIQRSNERYQKENIKLKVITLKDLFHQYISDEEYEAFENQMKEYVLLSRDILGYQSIKFLSSMNLAARKAFEEKLLLDWDYGKSNYQILNESNEKIKKYMYVQNYDLTSIRSCIKDCYLENGLYKAMIGNEDYAESFITSEWLYYSLKERKNFDYTAVVSGYLKSIEQLLYKLVMINIDNDCVIAMKSDANTKRKAIQDGITLYKTENFQKVIIDTSREKTPRFPYIDFISAQKDYMDSSIGTFEYFLRNNNHIFMDTRYARVISDMVSCFRTECRNGYFHTHNLHDEAIVEKTRENAILLYAILLGCIKEAMVKKDMFGIIETDCFNEICKEIREIRHYSLNFIFEYEDGTEKKMIYDSINNTAEYNEEGIEYYDKLIFYEVPDFSMETYQMLDTEKREDWKTDLTEKDLPRRIYCYDRKKNIHEVFPLK